MPRAYVGLCATPSFLHGMTRRRRSAFEVLEDAALRLDVPRSFGVSGLRLFCFDESGERLLFEKEMLWSGTEAARDIYLADLPTERKGLFFLRIFCSGACGGAYAVRQGDALFFTEEEASFSLRYSVSDFRYPQSRKKLGGVIYHVFVDRFAKGSVPVPLRADARREENWESGIPEYPPYPGAHLENNTFFGGTLYGVIEKLDRIASLGVNTIYLSPIFEAYSNHKYDTADYKRVDAMFGGEEALSLLIGEAKKRGIGILLDGVFNHTGSDSVYFNKKGRYPSVGAYQSKDSPYYDWYEFQKYPDRYTAWWGIEILPRIHPDRPACRSFFTGKGGVIEQYAALGIDGFRLDVADELSDDFIADIKRTLAKADPEALLYGEVWEDASEKIAYGVRKTYYLGSELDGVMNYPLRTGLISYIRYGECDALRYALTEVTANAPKRIADLQMNLLGTHDTPRILTVLGGPPEEGRTNDELAVLHMSDGERAVALARLKAAYTVLATLPGLPTVYYGDEAGLEGYHDPFNRRPYPWGREDVSLLRHYERLGELRKKYSVYREGDLILLHLSFELLLFARLDGDDVFLTACNRSEEERTLFFSKKVRELLGDTRCERYTLSPMTAAVFKLHAVDEFEISEI